MACYTIKFRKCSSQARCWNWYKIWSSWSRSSIISGSTIT